MSLQGDLYLEALQCEYTVPEAAIFAPHIHYPISIRNCVIFYVGGSVVESNY